MITAKDLTRLFSLETLDTRFIIPATAPPREALEAAALDPANPLPVQDDRKASTDHVQPSKWNTSEFYFYYLVILVCVPLMFKAVIDVSKGWCIIDDLFVPIVEHLSRITSKLL